MKYTKLDLDGAFLIDVEPFTDARGFFTRTFCKKEFAEHNLEQNFVQSNHSGTNGLGVVRGMHFQHPPYGEVKLIKCVQGKIFDVIVDVRKDSPTYLKWFGAELSAENKRMMYVPKGFAHGFQTLTEYSEIVYLVSEFYNKESEGGIHHLDPSVNIKWPLPVSLVSDKDKSIKFVDASFRPVIM